MLLLRYLTRAHPSHGQSTKPSSLCGTYVNCANVRVAYRALERVKSTSSTKGQVHGDDALLEAQEETTAMNMLDKTTPCCVWGVDTERSRSPRSPCKHKSDNTGSSWTLRHPNVQSRSEGGPYAPSNARVKGACRVWSLSSLRKATSNGPAKDRCRERDLKLCNHRTRPLPHLWDLTKWSRKHGTRMAAAA